MIQRCKTPLNIQVRVFDELGHEFDNFTSKNDKIEWLIEDNNLLKRSSSSSNSIEIDTKLIYFHTFQTQNLAGESNIEAKFKNLNSKLFIKLIDNLQIIDSKSEKIIDSQITIINHPINEFKLNIIHGSGYYFAATTNSNNQVVKIIDFSLNENELIKKSLFRLMNLKYKLNTNSSNLRLIDSELP